MKIGLVVEGGGMKCAYNAAILDAFLITISHLLTALARLADLETWPAIWPDNGAEICAFYGAYSQPRLFWAKKLFKARQLVRVAKHIWNADQLHGKGSAGFSHTEK